jgi:hypothetical protein
MAGNEIIAPVAGGSSSSGGTNYPLQNTQVYRPGQMTTDVNGKKVTAGGGLYTALYNGTYAEALAIRNEKFRTPQDQNYIKTLMLQSGLYANKQEFQTSFWSTADTAAFADLLKEANSAGGYSWEEMTQVYQQGGKAGGGPQVQKSINLSDPKTANAIIDSAGRTLLGRDMSEGEKNRLRSALTQAEQASPSISTTTQSGNTYTTKTTGGLDMAGKGEVIEQNIMADEKLLPEAVNNQLNGYGDIIARLAAGQ